MRYLFSNALFFLLLTISPVLVAQPTGTRLGAGISLGSPSGLSARYFMSASNSVMGVLGWRGGDNGAVYFQADYLFHYNNLPKIDFGTLSAFYGGGANLYLADNSGLGIQGTAGVSLFLNELPLEFAFYVSPGIGLVPSTDFRVGTGLSLRYYFQ